MLKNKVRYARAGLLSFLVGASCGLGLATNRAAGADLSPECVPAARMFPAYFYPLRQIILEHYGIPRDETMFDRPMAEQALGKIMAEDLADQYRDEKLKQRCTGEILRANGIQ